MSIQPPYGIQINLQQPLNLPDLLPLTQVVGGSSCRAFYRFGTQWGSEAVCMQDLTGNGNTLIKRGNPTMLPAGVSVNTANGYEIPLLETKGYLYWAIARTNSASTGATLILGRYNSTGNRLGSMLQVSQGGGNVTYRHAGFIKPATGTIQEDFLTNFETIPIANRNTFNSFAARLIPSTEQRQSYQTDAVLETVTALTPVALNAPPYATDGVSNRALSLTERLGIGWNGTGNSYTDFADVLEIGIFDDTMTSHVQELTNQLKYSKRDWLALGVTIS
jgi:hypothetical protein